MVDVSEHIYDDDPQRGHVDVKTVLKGVSYFFIGNGLLQSAIQYAPAGEGTPLGLIIMDAERFGKKRDALTFNPQNGLEDTQVKIKDLINNGYLVPQNLKVLWSDIQGIPAVLAEWSTGALKVKELFYCPDNENSNVVRELHIENSSASSVKLEISTGIPGKRVVSTLELAEYASDIVLFQYTYDSAARSLGIETIPKAVISKSWQKHWQGCTNISFQDHILGHFFHSASVQLPAVISKTGKMDASIWQYNREWVRDQSFAIMALLSLGQHEIAKTMLIRLIKDFISDEGDAVDSSERRSWEDVELDQNGVLLMTLKEYVLWSGDYDIIGKYWDKIATIAEFPFKEQFRHQASGMLYNNREYWERHHFHGIDLGMELTYQFFNVLGLDAAVFMARTIGKNSEAERWSELSRNLKTAILHHPQYALVDNNGLIKRRKIDGDIQDLIEPMENSGVPPEAPLCLPMKHSVNPDSSIALAIAYGFISPHSDIAKASMQNMEALWGQSWEGGGYARYNTTSEPDSAGPWPFASVFIARAYAETGDMDKVQRVFDWLNTVPGAAAGSWFEYFGPRISPPYPQIGVIPWTWAEIVLLCVRHLVGFRLDKDGIHFRPRVLPGLNDVSGSLQIRGYEVKLNIKTEPGRAVASFKTDGNIIASDGEEIVIKYPDKNISIEAALPKK